MSRADATPSIGEDVTPEDCRRTADTLREKGLTLLPDKLERFADQMEGRADD